MPSTKQESRNVFFSGGGFIFVCFVVFWQWWRLKLDLIQARQILLPLRYTSKFSPDIFIGKIKTIFVLKNES